MAWEPNDIDGDHVVAILSERVSDDYLLFLRQRGVSYILAGESDVDLTWALGKIRSQFGVKTLMLEGGGRINGSMIEAGLIDELSLLVAPISDGRIGTRRCSTSRGRIPSRSSYHSSRSNNFRPG